MKKLFLGTTLLAGLAGPALATGPTTNTLYIDNGGVGDSVQSLSIIQDATAPGNTVSGNGAAAPGGGAFPIHGKWSAVSINQTGTYNVLQGAINSATTAGSLTANYTTTTTLAGGNVHSLTIGATTAPVAPSVTINVTNNGATNNAITDSFDGASLNYNLALTGYGNTIGNAVLATTGGVTLTEGGGSYGITGHSNTVANTLTSGAGTVAATLLLAGNNNGLTNAIGTSGGAITLTQSITGDSNVLSNTINTSAGTVSLTQTIVGASNSIHNNVGVNTAVASFEQTLNFNGPSNSNMVTNTVDGAGIKVVDQTASSSSNNVVHSNLSSAGMQTANLTLTGSSYVDYAINSAASNSYANVGLSGMTGTSVNADIVRVEQTATAALSDAYLTVNGGGFKLGTLTAGLLTGETATVGSGAGVSVYQNSASAYLNASFTGAANSYTAQFKQ